MCDIPIEIVAIVKSWMTPYEQYNLTKDAVVNPYYEVAKKFVEENTPNEKEC